jgi:hypothetical protein
VKVALERERQEVGRWIAKVAQLAGVLACGGVADEAISKAEVQALRALAERVEHGEAKPHELSISVPAAA